MSMKAASVLVGVALVALAGCTTHYSTAPGTGVPMAPLTTTATYDVLGDATGTATAGYLFYFIPLQAERKVGAIGGVGLLQQLQGGGLPATVNAALYQAIEAQPGADAILSPRWRMVSKNYIIYREDTATVKGKAVRYNPNVK
ncbi:MAG: hypothetical protein FJ291_19360 [Planctomycetes bacterium]|nr:hypothetical protein [Planctomycetota bacterium]